MLGLRNYLLPQMDAQNIGTQLMFLSPTLLALVAGMVALFLFSFLYYRKSSKIKVFRTLSHLPFGKGMIQAYFDSLLCQRMGQSRLNKDWSCLQIFYYDAEAKSQLFKDWKRLSSFFRPWSILFQRRLGDILFQKNCRL